MRTPVVLFALLTVGAVMTACTSFDSIDRGVCGNGLVEPGEDCDSSEASCVRCAVTCRTAADCPNAAYTCGTDSLCAAPSGELSSPVVAGPFQVDDVTVTDIDRDGIGDVLGVSSASLSLRFGDRNARLERSQSVLTPPHISTPAFGDIDGDGATDVAYSSADGLVAYGSHFAELAPLASSKALVNSSDGTTLDLKRIVKLDRRAFVGLVDGHDSGAAFVTFDVHSGFTITAPCFQGAQNVKFDKLDLDTLEVYSASETDSVVAIRLNTASPRYCVMAFHLDTAPSELANQVWKVTDITPATLAAGTKKLVLADLDFDNNQNCPGLVSQEQGFKSVRYWGATTVAQHCAFTAGGFSSLAAPDAPDSNERIVGHVELNPGILFCAHDLLVTNSGLWVYVNVLGNTGWGKIYSSPRPLASSTSADLDGDGLVDGVLVAASEDDIDIVYRKKDPVDANQPAFILYRLDTASEVSDVATGDFDGNGAVDLAFVENLGDYARISVAYDHHDFLSPPVQVAAVQGVDDIVPLPVSSTEDASAITTDLFVLLPPTGASTVPSLSILLGSTQGTMIPVIDPRNGDGAGPHDKDVTQMTTVVIGTFFASTADKLHDLLVFAPLLAPAAGATHSPQVWRLPGTATGPDGSVSQPVTTSGFADCEHTADAGLCIADAEFLAWPDGATDAVIAVDRSKPPHAVSFQASAAAVDATALPVVIQALTDKAPVRALERADLDGDGTDELIIVTNGRGDDSRQNVILTCSMNGPTPTECVDVASRLLDMLATDGAPATECVDAAPAHIKFRDRTSGAGTSGVDLVVACHEDASDGTSGSALYRVGADGTYALLARTSTRIASIEVGDVTGDGVEDVLAIEGDQGVKRLVVFPQCSSRNAASCGGGK